MLVPDIQVLQNQWLPIHVPESRKCSNILKLVTQFQECQKKKSALPERYRSTGSIWCYHQLRCEPTCGYFHEIVYDVCVCNLFDVVKIERWRQLIFVWRKYELSAPFGFDNVTHVTHERHTQSRGNIHTDKSGRTGDQHKVGAVFVEIACIFQLVWNHEKIIDNLLRIKCTWNEIELWILLQCIVNMWIIVHRIVKKWRVRVNLCRNKCLFVGFCASLTDLLVFKVLCFAVRSHDGVSTRKAIHLYYLS